MIDRMDCQWVPLIPRSRVTWTNHAFRNAPWKGCRLRAMVLRHSMYTSITDSAPEPTDRVIGSSRNTRRETECREYGFGLRCVLSASRWSLGPEAGP